MYTCIYNLLSLSYMYIHVLVYNILYIHVYMYTCIYNVALKHNPNLYTSVFQVLSITLLEVSHI